MEMPFELFFNKVMFMLLQYFDFVFVFLLFRLVVLGGLGVLGVLGV